MLPGPQSFVGLYGAGREWSARLHLFCASLGHYLKNTHAAADSILYESAAERDEYGVGARRVVDYLAGGRPSCFACSPCSRCILHSAGNAPTGPSRKQAALSTHRLRILQIAT